MFRSLVSSIVQALEEDSAAYNEMLRMNFEAFQAILTPIGPEVTKHQLVDGHRVISATARVTLTQRFLAIRETKNKTMPRDCVIINASSLLYFE